MGCLILLFTRSVLLTFEFMNVFKNLIGARGDVREIFQVGACISRVSG